MVAFPVFYLYICNMKKIEEEKYKEIFNVAIDELYSQYESEHSFRCTRYIHPMFYNGTFSKDNSYQPEKPEPLMTKEEFINELNDSESKWSFGLEVLFFYLFKKTL